MGQRTQYETIQCSTVILSRWPIFLFLDQAGLAQSKTLLLASVFTLGYQLQYLRWRAIQYMALRAASDRTDKTAFQLLFESPSMRSKLEASAILITIAACDGQATSIH
jgi:hypothetical protein